MLKRNLLRAAKSRCAVMAGAAVAIVVMTGPAVGSTGEVTSRIVGTMCNGASPPALVPANEGPRPPIRPLALLPANDGPRPPIRLETTAALS